MNTLTPLSLLVLLLNQFLPSLKHNSSTKLQVYQAFYQTIKVHHYITILTPKFEIEPNKVPNLNYEASREPSTLPQT